MVYGYAKIIINCLIPIICHFNMDGHVLVPSNLRPEDGMFIRAITISEALDNLIMTDNF